MGRARRRRAAGFTLVELVLVLVLTAILAAVAGPRFFDTGDFDRRFALDDTLAALRYARQLAVATGCEVRFTLDAAAGSYRLDQRALQGNCGGASTDFGRAVEMPVEVAPARSPPAGIYGADAVITFDPLGRAVDATGAASDFSLSVGGRTIRVVGETGYAHEA